MLKESTRELLLLLQLQRSGNYKYVNSKVFSPVIAFVLIRGASRGVLSSAGHYLHC